MSTPTRSRWWSRATARCPSRRKSLLRRACWNGSGNVGHEPSCYEAGPFGYGLHRQLEALGVHNLVVCAQSWDELSTGVKTDKSDARALCVRLALYAAGNRRVFSVVRVPTPKQEQARAESRLREQLRRTRQRIEAQGRSLLLTQGCRVTGRWWQSVAWLQLSRSLPGWLVDFARSLARVYFKGAPENGAPDPNGGRGRYGVSTGWIGGSEQ